jgi:hypothetical protein
MQRSIFFEPTMIGIVLLSPPPRRDYSHSSTFCRRRMTINVDDVNDVKFSLVGGQTAG